jgi:WD40 repeat protein
MKTFVCLIVLINIAAVDRRCAAQEPDSIKPRMAINGHEGTVKDVAFSPDSKSLASSSEYVRLWDVKTGKPSHVFKQRNGALHQVAFLPDGKSLISATGGGTLRRWDLTAKAEHKTVLINAHGSILFALSPEGARVAVNYSEKLQTAGASLVIWDLASGKVKTELEPGTEARRWRFSPDGKTLAAAYENGEVKFWDVASGKVRNTARPWGDTRIEPLAYSPDGRLLALQLEGFRIRLWNVEKMQESSAMSDNDGKGKEEPVFSPDGRLLAAISNPVRRATGRPEVILWNVSTGRVEHRLAGDDSLGTGCIAFSPDGKMIAGGTFATKIPPLENARVLIWDLPESK